jgi:immune inhibitor A
MRPVERGARPSVQRLASLIFAATLLVALAGCSFWASSPRTPVVGPGCPAWTAGRGQPNIPPPSATDPASLAAYNAQLVDQTLRPVANPYLLTQRVMTHQRQRIACAAPTTPADEQVGDERKFWVINASQNGYHRIRARLDYVTPLLYVYVQDGATVDGLGLKNAADQFEATLYATDRANFGNQWSLGPNHDAHITLLNVRGLGPIGGYFSSNDEYPSAISPFSNDRQILYLNLSGGATPGSPLYNTTLAHEFQHMIHWWARPGDPSWVNEGMSMLAQYINGLSTQGDERAWLNAPQTPLVNGWTDDAGANIARYGAAYAFMDYLYERYGGAGFLRAFMASSDQVPQAFDSALAHQHSRDHFDDAYARFVLAALLNDPALAHGAYSFAAFPGERAKLTGTITTFPYASAQEALPQYGAAYYDVRPQDGQVGPRTLTINFAGAPTTSILPNSPYAGATPSDAEWWSNSGDNMDTTLTRTLDLTAANLTPTPHPSGDPTAGAGATPTATPGATPTPLPTATPNPQPAPVIMTFQAWYSLEQNFDYAYVEVSTDNGVTWNALPATTSTNSDPNGKNLGHGMTGVSGGGDTPQWTQESVDLSAYSGKKVLLRFETVTDDAVHQPGFALDDISIPAISYSDYATTGGDWNSNGWIRSNNMLPQAWIVQAVAFHAGDVAPTIQRVTVNPATDAGSVTFSDFGASVTHVELAVTPTTWDSFTDAPYQLTATAV